MDPIENLGRKPIIFFQNYLSLLLPYIGKCEVKVKIDKFYHYSEYVASIQVKIQFFLRATIYYEYRRVYRIWIYLRQYLIKRILVRNVFQNEMVQSEIMFMFQVTVPVTLVAQTVNLPLVFVFRITHVNMEIALTLAVSITVVVIKGMKVKTVRKISTNVKLLKQIFAKMVDSA